MADLDKLKPFGRDMAGIDPWTVLDDLAKGIIAAGTIYAAIKAAQASSRSKEAKDSAEKAHRQVQPSNGHTTAHTIEAIDRKIDRIEGQLDDLKVTVSEMQEDSAVEAASWAAIFAAHISDGHDPTGKWTADPQHRRNRRYTDPGDYQG